MCNCSCGLSDWANRQAGYCKRQIHLSFCLVAISKLEEHVTIISKMSGLTVAGPEVDMDESARVNLDLNLAPPLIPIAAGTIRAGAEGAGSIPGGIPDLGIRQEPRGIWSPGMRVMGRYVGARVHHIGFIRELPSGRIQETHLPATPETPRQFRRLQQIERGISASHEQSGAGSHQQLQLHFGFGPAQPMAEHVEISGQQSGVRTAQAPRTESQQMPEHPLRRQRLMRRFRPTRVSRELVENHSRTEGSLNVSNLPDAVVAPVVSNSLLESLKSVAETSSSHFECNICLEMACEPVVTPCGHLFCWPCLHHWLQLRSSHQECPVCKGAVALSSLTPIYGRGTESSAKIPSAEAGASSIPPRPQARRVESQRQRADRDEGERERTRRLRVNDLAAFHRRLEGMPLFATQRDPDDLLDQAEQRGRLSELPGLRRRMEDVPVFLTQRDTDELILNQAERQMRTTEFAALQRRLEAVPVFPAQRDLDDLQTLDQVEQRQQDHATSGVSWMRDEMLSWGRAARILRESLSDTFQTPSSLIGELRDRVGAPTFGGLILDPSSSSEEQRWQSREAARSVGTFEIDAEELRQVERRMRDTTAQLAHQRNDIINHLGPNHAEATAQLPSVRARFVNMNNAVHNHLLPNPQQPAQSQTIEVVPPFVSSDRSTVLPLVNEPAVELRPSVSGIPTSTTSAGAVAAMLVPRQGATREVLVRERRRRRQENVTVLLGGRQDSSETVVDNGAAASSEAGGTLLPGRKRRRLD